MNPDESGLALRAPMMFAERVEIDCILSSI